MVSFLVIICGNLHVSLYCPLSYPLRSLKERNKDDNINNMDEMGIWTSSFKKNFFES